MSNFDDKLKEMQLKMDEYKSQKEILQNQIEKIDDEIKEKEDEAEKIDQKLYTLNEVIYNLSEEIENLGDTISLKEKADKLFLKMFKVRESYVIPLYLNTEESTLSCLEISPSQIENNYDFMFTESDVDFFDNLELCKDGEIDSIINKNIEILNSITLKNKRNVKLKKLK